MLTFILTLYATHLYVYFTLQRSVDFKHIQVWVPFKSDISCKNELLTNLFAGVVFHFILAVMSTDNLLSRFFFYY